MVQQRTAVSGVEKVVQQRVLGGQVPEGKLGGVVPAERQRTGFTVQDKTVHLAAVDLRLFLVEARPGVGDLGHRRGVLCQRERLVGEVGRETSVHRAGRGRLGHG